MDIKDRIQKLLALSVNPNENEAKAALLKAQELMAKHKPVSYTHLDVYKRQPLFLLLLLTSHFHLLHL